MATITQAEYDALEADRAAMVQQADAWTAELTAQGSVEDVVAAYTADLTAERGRATSLRDAYVAKSEALGRMLADADVVG
jgi:hypothetical protein